MNRRVDDLMLERLVDGELDEQSFRDLMTELEQEPDGWRRCALAFLENQALERELKIEQPQLLLMPATSGAAPAPRSRIVSLLLTIAASFLLAFLAGHEYQKWRASRVDNSGFARNSARRTTGNLAGARTFPGVNDAPDSNGYRVDPWGSVQLVVDGPNGPSGQAIDVPVYSFDSASQLLTDDQSSVPPQVIEAFQKLGSQVRRSQYFAPVDLEDGQKIVLPVEQLDITPVSQTY